MAYTSSYFNGSNWLIRDADIYVSRNGSDDYGTGEPLNPFASIQKAVDMAVNGNKIVVGTGYFNEEVNGLSKDIIVQADGKVVMQHSGTGIAFSGFGNNTSIDGFFIKGYQTAWEGTLNFLSQCTIVDANILNFSGILRNVIFVNGTIETAAATTLLNDTFIDVQSNASVNHFTTVYDCHFDSACVFYFSTGVLLDFDFCNQQSGSTIHIDSNAYTNASSLHSAYNQYQASGRSLQPAFNFSTYYDYTLSLSSPLLDKGRFSKFIGARGLGFSYNTNNLPGALLSNVTVNNGTYSLINDFRDGFIRTPVLDLRKVRRISSVRFLTELVFNTIADNQIVDFAGEGIEPNHLVYEIKYGTTLSRFNRSDFKRMVWDKRPTIDLNNNGNAETIFDFNSQKFLSARYIQLRVILKRVEAFNLVQENDFCLLQENGDNIIWKY
jgi:hypothetical protein